VIGTGLQKLTEPLGSESDKRSGGNQGSDIAGLLCLSRKMQLLFVLRVAGDSENAGAGVEGRSGQESLRQCVRVLVVDLAASFPFGGLEA
jgi:hypothetical protein